MSRARSAACSRARRPVLRRAGSTGSGIGYSMLGSWDCARDIPRNETGGDSMKRAVSLGALLLVTMPAAAGAGTRPLKPADIFNLKEVSDPRVSPDGRSVAYEVTSLDADRDESDDIWMAPLAGGEAIRLTASPYSE